MDIDLRGRANLARRKAILLVMLMVLLPWAGFDSTELTSQNDESRSSARTWGAMGSNDTGWIDIVATGADPRNQTFAYGDLVMDFAPGAEISNMTFEVSVDGEVAATTGDRSYTIEAPEGGRVDFTVSRADADDCSVSGSATLSTGAVFFADDFESYADDVALEVDGMFRRPGVVEVTDGRGGHVARWEGQR